MAAEAHHQISSFIILITTIFKFDEVEIDEHSPEGLNLRENIIVLVDEAQFLTHSQVDQLFEVAVIQDISVICYGLRADFLLNGFEGSARLLLMAHSIEELKTICKCGQKAVANGRKIGGRFVFEGAQVAIEGEASVDYESLCARCYFKYKKQYENRKRS